jgi:cytochrome c553
MRAAMSACLLLWMIAGTAMAGDVAAGKARAAVSCAACHGLKGVSLLPDYPNLAGQKAPYLEKSLKAFRDGSRVDATMNAMAARLTDQEIADLAAYFSSLE